MTKKIVAIWAQDEQGVIGKEGSLPWSLPADLEHFKQTTTGHAMVMGRVTFEGMNKRVLPNRISIILTHDSDYQVADDRALVMHHVSDVLDWYNQQDKNLYVIGGGQLFSAFESHLDEIVRTDIHSRFEGDTYFPKVFDWSVFKETSMNEYERDAENPVDFTVRIFERREN
ncbi:dihydrofolate reductase [Streptococcus marmotae]|uniref:dihydrofolate reductase n=1 Tax=Streptococcus marmotae TaxID=1825069 RepID=UPI00082F97E3|nr:dihydrofolate reductase [Streptococcus marmotae]